MKTTKQKDGKINDFTGSTCKNEGF